MFPLGSWLVSLCLTSIISLYYLLTMYESIRLARINICFFFEILVLNFIKSLLLALHTRT